MRNIAQGELDQIMQEKQSKLNQMENARREWLMNEHRAIPDVDSYFEVTLDLVNTVELRVIDDIEMGMIDIDMTAFK